MSDTSFLAAYWATVILVFGILYLFMRPREAIHCHVPARPWRPFRIVDIETGTTTEARDGPHGGVTQMRLTTTQKATIEFGKPVDRKGRPARVDEDSIRWEVTPDDGQVMIERDPDNPYKATVVGIEPNEQSGGCVVSIVADADLDEDETREIRGSEPVLVLPAEAVGFGAPTVGEPEEVE